MNQQQDIWTKKQLQNIYNDVKGLYMTDDIAGFLIHSVSVMVEKSKHHPEVRERAANFLTELSIKEQKGERL